MEYIIKQCCKSLFPSPNERGGKFYTLSNRPPENVPLQVGGIRRASIARGLHETGVVVNSRLALFSGFIYPYIYYNYRVTFRVLQKIPCRREILPGLLAYMV